jgi:hypothetical protein
VQTEAVSSARAPCRRSSHHLRPRQFGADHAARHDQHLDPPAIGKGRLRVQHQPGPARTGALLAPMVRTRNGVPPATRLAQVNTSYGPAKSRTSTLSKM